MYKIYEKNNYIIVESIIPKETFYGLKKEVFVDKSNLDKPIYRIFNVRDLKDGLVLEIGQIQKENGDLYTESEFDTYYTENTGGRGISTSNPLPVTLGSESITITGNVNVGSAVEITNDNGNPIPVIEKANSTGANGTTPYKLISLATTNANVVKASAGNLYSIVAIGLTSTVRYLKLYNLATTPNISVDIPVMTIPIPANTQGAGVVIPFPFGVNFSNGIIFSITANASDSDNTAIGAGDVIVNLTYA